MSFALRNLRPALLLIVDGQVTEEYLNRQLEDAQGVDFICPRCYDLARSVGDAGSSAHRVRVWFAERGVPPGMEPAGRAVIARGTELGDLTLTGFLPTGAPLPCGWQDTLTDGWFS